jgi:peptidoglycan/xylan/chitin deacetylase (PgdA/CDA1 family)
MSQRRPFDHVAFDLAPERERPSDKTIRRRREGLAALAFISLVLGVGVGSGSGGHDTPTASAAAKAPVASRRERSWRPHSGPVPILMYHGVDNASDPPIAGLQVSRKDFRSQVAWLHSHGYEAVTMHELVRAWAGLGKLPKRPIVLTFDDGFHSQARVALPALRKLGWPAVLNLAVNNLTWDRGITFDEAQALIDAGWELASHTINHIDLRAASKQSLKHELVDSKRILEATFGQKVIDFCYPGGATDARVQTAVKKAGYHSATSVLNQVATADSPFNLSRIHVETGMTGAMLGAKIRAAATGDTPAGPGQAPAGNAAY